MDIQNKKAPVDGYPTEALSQQYVRDIEMTYTNYNPVSGVNPDLGFRSLGNNTESSAAPAAIPKFSAQSLRKIRFKLLDTARFYAPENHRIKKCFTRLGRGRDGEYNYGAIEKTLEGRAFYKGAYVCGNAWGCPVCAQKIVAQRTKEVAQALSYFKNNVPGSSVGLLTLTFPHSVYDDLKANVDALSKAQGHMKSLRRYVKLKKELGLVHSIKALEVLHGENGWHPHVHVILFFSKPISEEERLSAENEFYELWVKSCSKFGLYKPSREHGVRFDYDPTRQNGAVGKYLTKWAEEVSMGHMKSSKTGSRTPMQILKDIHNNPDKRDIALWVEFLEAFKGRAQLFWSQGLKDLVGVKELSDNQLAEQSEDGFVAERIVLDVNDFFVISLFKRHSEVLEIFENFGSSEAKEFILKLHKKWDLMKQ